MPSWTRPPRPDGQKILEELCAATPKRRVLAQAARRPSQGFLWDEVCMNGSGPIARSFTRSLVLNKLDFHRELVPRRGGTIFMVLFRGFGGHPRLTQ